MLADGVDVTGKPVAARLHIEPFLDRLPAKLSGGQRSAGCGGGPATAVSQIRIAASLRPSPA